MKLKRYLVFFGDHYYPTGGWDDFKGSFDDLQDAHNVLHANNWDWAHIIDSETEERVFQMVNF